MEGKSEELCKKIKFSDLCILFEKIEKTQGSFNKLKLLFNKEMKLYLRGQSIYPLLRLVLPLNDAERGNYGLKQALVAKTYVHALHLDVKISEDARRLINWKDPSKTQGLELSKIIVGDFGLILEDVLKSRVQTEYSQATIGEVNEILDSLANAANADEKTGIIRNRILNRFDANEQKWIARIIFRDLKIGLKHEQVLGGFYPNALQRYNECTNLKMVCEEEGTAASAEHTGIQLFTMFSPMLAKGFAHAASGQVSAVETAMQGQPFIMEVKLDGERMACHIGDDDAVAADGGGEKVMMYTRRGNDYTENYLPLAQMIRELVQTTHPGMNCILDGEVCAWDKATQCHLPFGHNLSIAKAERDFREAHYGRTSARHIPKDWDKDLPAWMMFIVFDVVYLQGPDSDAIIHTALEECGILGKPVLSGEIMYLPLAVRKKILQRLLPTSIPHRVELVPSKMVVSLDTAKRREAVEAFFNEMTLAGEEGLVIKNLNSTYLLGEKSRSSASWVKMKPEYGDQTEDLDLLILGAYYGEGKSLRGEGLSTFLCGVRDNNVPGKYQTLCKVGTGYSFEELRELREKLSEIAIPWNPRSPPVHLAHWSIAKRDDRPHVYFPPEFSIVLQLKCAELVESTSFSVGLTCRFPRVQRIRYDKAPGDVMRQSDIYEIKNQPRNTTHEVMELTGGVAKKRKRSAKAEEAAAAKARRRVQPVDDQFRVSNKRVFQEGRIFEGQVFCVLESEFHYGQKVSFSQVAEGVDAAKDDNYTVYTRDQIINFIRGQGGEVVASATRPECKVVAGSKRTFQINSFMERGDRDVIDFSYIIDCIEAGCLLPIKNTHYLGCSQATKAAMKGRIDVFGDSYTEDVTPDELLKIFSAMDDALGRCERISAAGYIPPPTKKPTTKKALAALEANPPVDRKEFREARRVVEDWVAVKGSGWRELCKEFLLSEEERIPVYDSAWNCMWTDRVVLYLDMYADLGELEVQAGWRYNKPLDVDLIDCSNERPHANSMILLYHRLIMYGAVISDSLHNEVTHIVMYPGCLARAQDIKDRLRMLRTLNRHSYEKRVVNMLWAEESLRNGRLEDVTEEFIVRL